MVTKKGSERLLYLGLLIALLVMALSGSTWAQGTATADLKGTITDPSGAVVPGANLQITNLANKVSATTTSSAKGEYYFKFMTPGRYKLTVKKDGFATASVPEIVLQVSIDVQLPITLKPGRLDQTVEVSATAERINTSEGTHSLAITNQQVRGLPIVSGTLGRTTIDVLPFLLPGITPTDGAGGADSQGMYMSINGSRASSIAFNFEGGDNNDPEWNRASSPMPNPDMLQEFTVVTNSYKAELGKGGGGVINAISKSGTNEYHGNLRYYLSNEALNAMSYWDTEKPRYRINTFGGQIGGPVRIPKVYNGKERTQFMFDYEETRTGQWNAFKRDVLTAAERNNGDFSWMITPNLVGSNTGPVVGGIAMPGVCNKTMRSDPTVTQDSAANAALGKYAYWVRTCTWPRNPFGSRDTDGTITGTIGRPTTFFENGMIPTSLYNPIALYYLKNFIPLPNDPAGGRSFNTYMPYSQGARQYTIKIDHKISNSDTISGTYFLSTNQTLSTSTTNLPLGSRQDSLNHNYNLVVRETHIFSPNIVNNFSATGTRFWSPFFFYSPGVSGLAPKEAGFTGINPQDPTGTFLGLPGLVMSGTVGVQITSGGGYVSAKTSWQAKDDLSISHGKHDLKFGTTILGYLFNKDLGPNNGSFGFSDGNAYGSGKQVVDFLLGIPNSYSQSTGNFFYPRQKTYSVYAQDDWRVSPSLTLNVGIRYELAPPTADKMGQTIAFRPGVQSLRVPSAPVGMIYPGDPDPILGKLPAGGYKTDKNNIAPRFGFAWAPRSRGDSVLDNILRPFTGDGKMSVRGGAGVFFDQPYGFTYTQGSFSIPFSVSQSITSTTMYQNNGTYANPFGTAPNPWPLDLTERKIGPSGTAGVLATLPAAITPFDPNFVTGYNYQYNLTVQRELPAKLTAEIAYVGSNTFKLQKQENLNPAYLAPGATTANLNDRRPYYCRTPTYPATCPVADRLFTTIMAHLSNGRANYNSLQARLTRRFAGGFSFDTSYTWQKALDDGTNPQISQLGGVSNQNRFARSNNDRKHQWVASYTWDVPKMPLGMFNRWINGWQFGGIVSYRTGTPIDIGQSVDTTLTGMLNNSRGTVDYVGPWRTFDPRELTTLTVPGVANPVTAHFYYDPGAFRIVPTPTDVSMARAGNFGRNVFNGPNLFNCDLSMIKKFRITEGKSFELRADMTNLLNHARFAYPNTTIGSASSGTISYELPGRQIQVTGRFTF